MLVRFEDGGIGVFKHALMDYYLQPLGFRSAAELIELLFDNPNEKRVWGAEPGTKRSDIESIWLFAPEDFINGWCDLPAKE